MPQFVERRRYRRFEIPGGEVRYKRITEPAILHHFSRPYPILNMSVGGLAFVCEEDFYQGEEIIIQLIAPNEKPINLSSIVRWQGSIALSADLIVGIEFMEFGNNKNLNPPEILAVLRRLYARYIKD